MCHPAQELAPSADLGMAQRFSICGFTGDVDRVPHDPEQQMDKMAEGPLKARFQDQHPRRTARHHQTRRAIAKKTEADVGGQRSDQQ